MEQEDDLSIYGYKPESSISHAAARAYERYGVELTNEDLQKKLFQHLIEYYPKKINLNYLMHMRRQNEPGGKTHYLAAKKY